jgi:hypothetical protein
MSIIAPMLLKQQVGAFKAETTTGTEISLAASDGTTALFNLDISQDTEFNQRSGQNSLDKLAGIVGAQVAKVKVTTELVGSGSAGTAPSWEPLILAAGTAVTNNGTSVTYAPVTGSTNMTSLTFGQWIDGRKYGARGVTLNMTMKGDSGKQVMVDWEGSGGWITPTNQANITPTFVTSPIPPRLVSATFQIDSTNYISRGFEFGLGNTIAVRKDTHSAAGVHSTAITDRDPYLEFDVEADSTKDWYADYAAGATAAASIVIGSTAGNIWTLTIPKMQQSQPPEKIDIDGVAGYKLHFGLLRNAVAGDDSFSLVLT